MNHLFPCFRYKGLVEDAKLFISSEGVGMYAWREFFFFAVNLNFHLYWRETARNFPFDYTAIQMN